MMKLSTIALCALALWLSDSASAAGSIRGSPTYQDELIAGQPVLEQEEVLLVIQVQEAANDQDVQDVEESYDDEGEGEEEDDDDEVWFEDEEEFFDEIEGSHEDEFLDRALDALFGHLLNQADGASIDDIHERMMEFWNDVNDGIDQAFQENPMDEHDEEEVLEDVEIPSSLDDQEEDEEDNGLVQANNEPQEEVPAEQFRRKLPGRKGGGAKKKHGGTKKQAEQNSNVPPPPPPNPPAVTTPRHEAKKMRKRVQQLGRQNRFGGRIGKTPVSTNPLAANRFVVGNRNRNGDAVMTPRQRRQVDRRIARKKQRAETQKAIRQRKKLYQDLRHAGLT